MARTARGKDFTLKGGYYETAAVVRQKLRCDDRAHCSHSALVEYSAKTPQSA